MTAEEDHISPALHADGAAVDLLDLGDFRLEVAQPVCAGDAVLRRERLTVCVEREERMSVHCGNEAKDVKVSQ